MQGGSRLLYGLLVIFFVLRDSTIVKTDDIVVKRDEAKKAFEYLNVVRQNPSNYSEDIGADLSDIGARRALLWNDTLAKVAEEKAIDMAKRNYFAHQTPEGIGVNIQIHQAGYNLLLDWSKEKGNNFFESIGAGYSDGVSLIKGLIKDEGTPSLGHRKHLLGIGTFWADCRDIGIGIAENGRSQYRTYASIIIAKHKF